MGSDVMRKMSHNDTLSFSSISGRSVVPTCLCIGWSFDLILRYLLAGRSEYRARHYEHR